MKDLVKTGVWENRTTWQDAVAFAQSDPDGVAIWFDDGSELTYRQGCEEAITLAASLTELSLRKGYVVSANLPNWRSEEHTSELPSLMRSSYAVFCLKKNILITLKTTAPQETNNRY